MATENKCHCMFPATYLLRGFVSKQRIMEDRSVWMHAVCDFHIAEGERTLRKRIRDAIGADSKHRIIITLRPEDGGEYATHYQNQEAEVVSVG